MVSTSATNAAWAAALKSVASKVLGAAPKPVAAPVAKPKAQSKAKPQGKAKPKGKAKMEIAPVAYPYPPKLAGGHLVQQLAGQVVNTRSLANSNVLPNAPMPETEKTMAAVAHAAGPPKLHPAVSIRTPASGYGQRNLVDQAKAKAKAKAKVAQGHEHGQGAGAGAKPKAPGAKGKAAAKGKPTPKPTASPFVKEMKRRRRVLHKDWHHGPPGWRASRLRWQEEKEKAARAPKLGKDIPLPQEAWPPIVPVKSFAVGGVMRGNVSSVPPHVDCALTDIV